MGWRLSADAGNGANPTHRYGQPSSRAISPNTAWSYDLEAQFKALRGRDGDSDLALGNEMEIGAGIACEQQHALAEARLAESTRASRDVVLANGGERARHPQQADHRVVAVRHVRARVPNRALTEFQRWVVMLRKRSDRGPPPQIRESSAVRRAAPNGGPSRY